MVHVQLDCETWGTTPGSAIRSIGAVTFELGGTDVESKTFYANVDTYSQLYLGLRIDEGTHNWWKRQAQEARDALASDQQSIASVLERFHQWWGSVGATHVWCQGANFDAVLWEAVCRALGRQAPWKFYNVRDTRTLYDLAGWDPKALKREGTYHNALDDARHQVACCREAYRRLKCPVTPMVNTSP